MSGGLTQLTGEEIKRIFREAGWTQQDRAHACVVASLSERGGFDEYLAEVFKRRRRAEITAARVALRRRMADKASQ